MRILESSDPSTAATLTSERLPVLPNEPWNGRIEELGSPRISSSPGSDGIMTNNKSARLVGASSHDKFRRRQAKKEILRRALTPPARRPTLRWLDFRPTPSRLRVMTPGSSSDLAVAGFQADA